MLLLDVRDPARLQREAHEVAHRDRSWGGGPTDRRRDPSLVRARLIAATVDLVSVVGVHDLRVTDLCDAAGVSRRVFYNYFADVWDVVHAAYLELDGDFRRLVQTACDMTPPGEGCATPVVHGVVSFVEQDPVRAEALFVQSLAAGPDVAVARIATVDWLVDVLRNHGSVGAAHGGRPGSFGPPALAGRADDIVLEIAVGGVLSVVASHVQSGAIAQLREHVPTLVATLTRVATVVDRRRRGGG